MAVSSGWPAILLSGLGGGLVGGFMAELGRRFAWRRDRRHEAYASLLDAAADFDQQLGDTGLAIIRRDDRADAARTVLLLEAQKFRMRMHRVTLLSSSRLDEALDDAYDLIDEVVDGIEQIPDFDLDAWIDRWIQQMKHVHRLARKDLGFRVPRRSS